MNMNITKDPEKAFNDHLWEWLEEFNRKSFIYGIDNPIEIVLEYPTLGEKQIREEVSMLESMEKWCIISIDQNKTVRQENGTCIYYIKKNYPTFQYVYSLFSNCREHNVEHGQLITMLRIIATNAKDHREPPDHIMDFIDGSVFEKKSSASEETRVAKIGYNPETGIGYNGKKKFKLKDGSAEHRVFSRLYSDLNKRVNRFDILELARFYESGEDVDPSRESDETEAINTVAKKLRSKVGLGPEQLVMNAGNLTLLGKKPTKSTPD
jgi:hypothetical protein